MNPEQSDLITDKEMDKMLMRSRIDVLNYMDSQLYHIMFDKYLLYVV